MNFARLWVCSHCGTVVATDAELDTRPVSCEACGNDEDFQKPRLARGPDEAEDKLSESGAGPGGGDR